MITVRRSLATLLIVLFTLSPALAQDGNRAAPQTTSLTITASAATGRVRFTAPSQVVQLHLEIYSEAGEKLFETVQAGSVMDYLTTDKAGAQLADGAYLCVVTVKTVSGKLAQKIGTLVMHEQQVSVRVGPAQPTAAQMEAIGPVEENSVLAVVSDGAGQPVTNIAHNGQDAEITRGTGALSFRLGNFYNGTDREQMRLTEEGNLGIGTDKPEARLDVNGMIRARQGFQFADGSVLNLAPQGGGLRVTLPSGEIARVNFAPNAVTGTANRIPKFATDGTSLLDSAIYQDPTTGFIGIGTTTPQHPFVVRRNGGSLGVHSVGELFVDRDDRTRSASLTVGTAGILKWIFGMPYQSDGFQVYDLTNNVSRFFVDPTNGNIGIGTTNPVAKLDVNSNSASTIQATMNGSGAAVYAVSNGNGWGVYGGSISGLGVYGVTYSTQFNAAGVFGEAGASSGQVVGVYGRANNDPVGTGVAGFGRATGGYFKSIDNTGTGVYGVGGNTGVNGSGVGYGGYFLSTGNNGTGVYGSGGNEGVEGLGANVGVRGLSNVGVGVYGTSSSDNGVVGESNGASRSGVYGFNTNANGVGGAFANTAGGTGLAVTGNAVQDLNSGGMVKAMLYFNPSLPVGQQIVRCYNSQATGAAVYTPPCGFTATGYSGEYGIGDIHLNFGFDIRNRFFSVTPEYDGGNTGANVSQFNVSELLVSTFYANARLGGTYTSFYVIVY